MPFARLQYFSNALAKGTSVTLLLPDAAVEPPYVPWLLLHGLSDDDKTWTRRTSLERYVEGLPVVVAMPDGGRGFYVDADAAYYTALAEELPVMLARYLPLREGWAVGGLSMGGYGALRFALGRPDRFRSAHSHSGAVGFGHEARYAERPDIRRLLEATTEGTNDLYRLAGSASPRPAVRIDCGTEDFLIEDNRAFSAHLREIGFEHEYAEYPGGHDWAYWDAHVREQIAFHRSSLGF